MARAQCQLWVCLGTLQVIIATTKRPPGRTENYPEACGTYWQPQQKTSQKTGLVLALQLFWCSMACLGEYILGWFTGV